MPDLIGYVVLYYGQGSGYPDSVDSDVYMDGPEALAHARAERRRATEHGRRDRFIVAEVRLLEDEEVTDVA